MREDEVSYQEDLENARLNQGQNLAVAGQAPAERKEPLVDMLKDMPYFLAIIVAIGKDAADFFFGLASSIPIIGTLIALIKGGSSPLISILFTILVMITIALLIFLAAPPEFFHNFMLLFGGTTIETIPVINLLPILTGAVVYIYVRKILQRLKKRMKKIPGGAQVANLATKAVP